MKTTIYYILLTTLASCLLISCTTEENNILKAPSVDATTLSNTRTATVKKKVAAQAYYYRTLTSFVKGSVTSTVMDDYPHALDRVNLVVLYEASAPWAELLDAGLPQATGDNNLNELLESYQLEIVKQFSIDQNNKGLVLDAVESLNDPVETARRLSLINHVLMVNIKEVPKFEALSIDQKDK